MPKKEKKFNVKDHVEDNVCDLNLTGLSEVPVKQIAVFKRVTTLDLSNNKLVNLGESFPSLLKRLVKLDLSRNQIENLPDDFGLLINLRHLDCYDNKIEHLPLSFGDLKNLRYLDLKSNPLTPALSKVVGMCLTAKDCSDSARRTVKFLAVMQEEALRAKVEFRQQMKEILPPEDLEELEKDELKIKPKAKPNKKAKGKKKGGGGSPKNQNNISGTSSSSNGTNNNNNYNKKSLNNNSDNIAITDKQNGTTFNGKQTPAKLSKSKKNSNNARTTTARSSIFIFLLLLAINVFIIYLIRFKNPEIADKLVEVIPPQYRNWILTKTEFFRLRVTDWISEFRTPPEEN